MNTRFTNSLKTLFADRAVLAFAVAIFVLGAGYITYVVLSLHPSELQVAAHYSAFGETHYYRNKWYYLISFAVFGLIFIVAHIGLLVKLASRDVRPLALAFGWLSLVMIPLLFILTYSVLGIAF
jgi:hypothetical protein